MDGCKELFWGVADGISGPFVLPFVGLKREGPIGFFKGFGHGVLGLPVKFSPVSTFRHIPGQMPSSANLLTVT
jgi:hypothetical protein